MATSTIPRPVADPVFEDFTYNYHRNNHGQTVNTFPSTPSVSNYTYAFDIAKAGYKAVGVVRYDINNQLIQYNYADLVNFDYANQVVRLFDRTPAGSPESDGIHFTAVIKYMRL